MFGRCVAHIVTGVSFAIQFVPPLIKPILWRVPKCDGRNKRIFPGGF